MIEMKMFVSKGTILQNKISPVEWQNQNIFITDKIGGSFNKSGDQDHWEKRSDFKKALSTLNRLHQESGERPLRPLPYWKYLERHPSSSSSSSWWQWSGSWWSSSEFKESQWKRTHAKVYDRTVKPVVLPIFGSNLRRMAFTNLLYCSLFCCNWIVYSWRRSTATDGKCKDNTTKDPFSQCENPQNLQGIHIQVKSECVGTLRTTELMTQSSTTSTSTCLMWPQTWSMCTLTRTTTEDLVSALCLFECSVFLSC